MIDPTLWQRTDMRQALACHDLRTVFRLMQRHGMSQTQIGAATGLAQSDVSLLVCGTRRATAYTVYARLAQQLHLPRGWLGVAYDDESLALTIPTCQRTASWSSPCHTCRRTVRGTT